VPDSISTDMHPESMLLPAVSMPNCISKLMALGMSLQDSILRSTVNPARAIHRFPELGTLAQGRVADIAVYELQQGVFAFVDSWDKKLLGTRNLKCVLTVRAGEILFDENGLSMPLWSDAGNHGVIRRATAPLVLLVRICLMPGVRGFSLSEASPGVPYTRERGSVERS
jgi:dihydroorotase